MPARYLLALCLFTIATPVLAGSDAGKAVNSPILADPLAKGDTEIEMLGGFFHSPITVGGAARPQFDYSGVDIRYGRVLSPGLFENSRFLSGNFEMLIDALGDGVTTGAGTYVVGGSLLFRYNFVKSSPSPGTRIIPYLQLGGGGLHSDAAEEPSQRIIGGNFEFLLEADLGLRFVLSKHLSLLVEGGFQHISNADTASRNVGVNALGGRVGFGWVF